MGYNFMTPLLRQVMREPQQEQFGNKRDRQGQGANSVVCFVTAARKQ